ncbi:MAG TPA: SCP2 sterol-binding domain-containing protein, partial [Blastocatellia bacterium]|nr:SCP2 sterol-binding domain-containing protein [Blastocatellia bacterium]
MDTEISVAADEQVAGDPASAPESSGLISKVFQSLPSRFQSGKVSKQIIYYFSIDDEKWTVTVRPDECEVTQGKATEEADCFLKTSSELLLKIFRGEHTPSIMDFMSGKIKSNRPDLLLT